MLSVSPLASAAEKAPKCSFAIPPGSAPDTLQGRAEEGAGDAHVVVVGRADVHHKLEAPACTGSRRRPKSSVSPAGAHDVPGEGAQGHGVALQLEASHRALPVGTHRKLPSVVSVGSSSTSPRVASVTSSAPPSRDSCFSSNAEGRRVLLHLRRVAGLQVASTVPAVWLGRPVDHQQHGQRRELHHGGRRVHGHADGLGRSNCGFAAGALTGATLTITGAASAGPLDCESLVCTFTATSGGVLTGSVVCGNVTSSGRSPRLQHAHRDQHSDFSDDLFLTINWAG